MKKFYLVASATFSAHDLDEALDRLALHFTRVNNFEESNLLESGGISVKTVDSIGTENVDSFGEKTDWDSVIFDIEPIVPFKMHQCYQEAGSTKQISCICGSRIFEIGQGSHYTVSRCVSCGKEAAIHDG